MKLLENIPVINVYLCVHFEPPLGQECAYVCHDLRAGKEGIYCNNGEYKASNSHTSDLHLRK